MVSARCYSASTFVSSKTQQWLDIVFIWLSGQIPRRRCLFLCIGILIPILFSLGLLKLQIENRFTYLVIPRDTVLWQQFSNIVNTFGEPPALLSLLITTDDEQSNMLAPSNLNHTYDIFTSLYDSQEIQYRNRKYPDVCLRAYPSSPVCASTTNNLYGVFFANNMSNWQNMNKTLSIVNQPSSSIEYYVGGLQYTEATISGATVLRITYELESISDNEYSYGLQREFDDYWLQNKYYAINQSSAYRVYHLTSRSLEDEINRVLVVDFAVFSSSFIGMLVYLMLLLSTYNCTGIRVWLSLSIILILILSLCVGYGVASLLGIELSIMVMLVPYILIGVGVDDMIIMVDTYDRVNHDLTKTLQISGISITLTSLCSFVAFFIASFAPDSPPSIIGFCATASASFLALYLLQFFIFVPLLLYDQDRMDSNGNFCIPCYRHQRKTLSGKQTSSGCSCNAPLLLQHTIVRALKYRICRWIVILLFVTVLVLSAYFIPEISRETDQALMVPSDSYYLEYQSVFESHFNARLLTEVNIIIENEDFSDFETRQNIYSLFDDLSKHQNYISITEWLQPFEQWLSDDREINVNNISNEEFYAELQQFMNVSQHKSWEKEIVYGFNADSDTTYVSATRFYLFAFKENNERQQYQDYLDYNDMMSNNSVNGYMFEETYGFAYLAHIIVGLTVQNMLLCASGVFIVLLIFMDLRLALFCFVVVAMIDVWFLGWMYFFNISLDPITYACLVMAVGLTVDYLIHITHSIAKAEPKDKYDYGERLELAMKEMGGSVFKGAVTTLLGGFPLLFSSSKGFVYFYVMVAGIILGAVLHGLLLTPALLGECQWIFQSADRKQTADGRQLISKTSLSMETEMIAGDTENENQYGSI